MRGGPDHAVSANPVPDGELADGVISASLVVANIRLREGLEVAGNPELVGPAMAVVDEGCADARALSSGCHTEELEAEVRFGRESRVIGLDLPEHGEQTAGRVRATALQDGAEAVRAHRIR